jgi:thioredoxin-related protein
MKTIKPSRVRFNIFVFAIAVLCGACSNNSNLGYDASTDPSAQLQQVIVRAKDEDKRILIISGGEWCRWCHLLDSFMKRNADVATAVDETFVVMKVYVGEENENVGFFSRLPESTTVPHFWVLSAEGAVLLSLDTEVFESGNDWYDKKTFLAFVSRWTKS